MHIFHKWSKWTIETYEVDTKWGKGERDYNERSCKVCGLTEKRRV